MSNPAPGYLKNPDHHIWLEASPRRVRVQFGGEWIADSTDMVLMYEANHLPVYYFPVKDVRLELCLLYASPSPRDRTTSRMPSSA